MSFKIDFVIAGQPKSGSTALAEFLSQHPDICISLPKEPNYFATDFMRESDKYHGKKTHFLIRSEKEYSKSFNHRKKGQLLGEASVNYAYSKEAAKNIAKHNPKCKIIIILRDPIDYMHSMHMHFLNTSIENEPDFSTSLELEELRKKGKNLPNNTRLVCPSYLFYNDRAHYYEQLKRYFTNFPKENILILTQEEFNKNNEATFKKVSEFLNIDTKFTPVFKKFNATKTSRNQKITNLIYTPQLKNLAYKVLPNKLYKRTYQTIHKLIYKSAKRSPLDKKVRSALNKSLANDIFKTEKLTGIRLSKIWNVEKEFEDK